MKMFENNIINTYGDAGRKWLADLPRMVNDLALRWNLSGLKPIDNLSYNYVLSGFQGVQPIVLKLGFDINGLSAEALALKAFKGQGAVKVLDQTNGALLLEGVTPGHSLKQFFPNRDTEAIAIASEVIRILHSIPKINLKEFPTINDWLTSLDTDYEILKQHLPRARTLRDELLNTMDTPILLHGDLHHDNILFCHPECISGSREMLNQVQHDNGWKIIDPKGVMGELAFEVGCFIRNPLDDLPNHYDCLAIITNRIDEFSKNLRLDPNRIVKWCYVQTVLAAVWAMEDNMPHQNVFKTLSHFDLLLN